MERERESIVGRVTQKEIKLSKLKRIKTLISYTTVTNTTIPYNRLLKLIKKWYIPLFSGESITSGEIRGTAKGQRRL